MQLDRAQEILHSPDTIQVTYHGTPIWITNIDTNSNMAQVKMLGTSNNIIQVPVNELTETWLTEE